MTAKELHVYSVQMLECFLQKVKRHIRLPNYDSLANASECASGEASKQIDTFFSLKFLLISQSQISPTPMISSLVSLQPSCFPENCFIALRCLYRYHTILYMFMYFIFANFKLTANIVKISTFFRLYQHLM